MIVKTLLAAIVAGLIAGVFMTAAQEMRVVPLILHAEEYEGETPAADQPATQDPAAAGHDQHSSLSGTSPVGELLSALSPVTPAYAHEHEGEHEEGGIMFGLSRFSGTLLANLVTGAGFSLLLAGVSLVIGYPITLANGALWGACGWLAVHLLPAIGLPPELPGFPAAELGDRQVWWAATVLFSAAGLYLLALRRELVAKIAGLVLIAAPQFYGAPQPLDISSNVPAVLGAEFAVAALATTLAFWLVLGVVSGFINDRFVKAR
ncbi:MULTISPECIES: CbtA family protein [unclassified Sinorhizobium]|uniref:CbtA family protein n=1 Tax=unclassified Sinorhizobium TaxID=2613772 RepID=UPI0024C28A3B|nr:MULTISPECIES: CbtA family protein [unclassified Sinorhizobium]MDK1375020.1 CbtA family protein [Sinorhizobium sp. 6-70]MDK1480645.1 CbtA family protein [Sinorhizobium sp. 6-117]